jgi:cell division protein FtsL
MMNRTVVIRRHSCCWQPKTNKKTKTPRKHTAGFIHPVFGVLACVVFSGILYLYSINHTAVKGLEIQRIEKEITQARQENENLKIQVAQINSLYRIEENSAQLEMSQLKDVTYIEQESAVTLASSTALHKN